MRYARPTIFVPYHEFGLLVRRGTRAEQPLAENVTEGSLYCVLDENQRVERSNGAIWQGYGGGDAPDDEMPPHGATHEPGGTDPMTVDAAAGVGSLRTLGTGPQQAAAGNDPRFSTLNPPMLHAASHRVGGTDVLDVKALGGYPGGTTAFLRGDGTFAPPPGGGSGGGDMFGPAAAVANALAVYDGTSGKLLKDSGVTVTDIVNAVGDVKGPATSVNLGVPFFNGTNGKLLASSDISINAVARKDTENVFWPKQVLQGANPELVFIDSSVAVDHRSIRLRNAGEALYIQPMNDDGSPVASVGLVVFRNGAVGIPGTLEVVGGLGSTPLDRTKLTTSAGSVLLGRGASGAGAVQEILLGTGLSMTGTTLNAAGGSGTRVGEIIMHGSATPPVGTLPCNGAAVSRATYAELFTAIGAAWGAGDGSTTFNVPDMRGRAPIGTGTGAGLTDRVLNGAYGAEAVVLSTAQMPSHGHTVSDPGHGHSISDPSHNHTLNDPTHVHGLGDPGHNHTLTDPTHAHSVYDPTHAHGVADPNHAHVYAGFFGGGVGGDFPYGDTAGQYRGEWTDAQPTGIGIYGAYTGIGIYAAYTGITIAAAGTGMWVGGAYTGCYNSAAVTGITIVGNVTGVSVAATGGGGAHDNMPPSRGVPFYIFYQ